MIINKNTMMHRKCHGTGEAGQQPDSVRQGEAGVGPYRQGADQQRHSRNAIHQHSYCQPAPAGDFGQAAGEELHCGLPCGKRPEVDLMHMPCRDGRHGSANGGLANVMP